MIYPLYATRSRIPYLDRAVLGTGDHPFALAVKGHACDIPSVTVEGKKWIGVRGADVVEFDIVVASSSEVALVWRDAEAVDLRVWMLNCPGAYAREGFPKADGVVVASCDEFRQCSRKDMNCSRLAYLCKGLRSLLLPHFCQMGLPTRITLGQSKSYAVLNKVPSIHVLQRARSMLNAVRPELYLKLVLHLNH